MGRVKLKIKRLESISNQQVTYSRRRNGILKKAKELFILCDIDIVLLMFSPTGKATLFRREYSNIEEVITKFTQLTPQKRTKRIQEQIRKKRLKFPTKSEKGMGIDTNPFPEIGEAAAQVGMPDFQNLSLKELEEVTMQMHVASQAAFRKNTRSSPVDG
ncbi:agamous-like MADS-box protein AGL65 [Camellia sinensis]|uniref:agamous-like MADS-box protein AGL65 n=1 Tax=Camellia sinensis TaxID=4442 RepID=UPI0010365E02|nr:agamous-like MADS-box protein AGL65 [Camellia sinensis]